jgi:cellulose synthase/poly-beta-1,6-N-acetylglucosamine synthase-like glycosyltransferase
MAGTVSSNLAMTNIAGMVVWGAALIVGYVYIGYPLALWIVAQFRDHEVRRGDITPTATLLISVFNEESSIRKKLENSLALSYPKGRLEIVVVSDASTDGTDSIVESFADKGIRLLKLPRRQGKTSCLNAAVKSVGGEIIVFSDANILYQPDAVTRLVRNFADPEVGCVSGDSRYVNFGSSAAHSQENSYWNYERFIRTMESRLGSTVGGDGAIFAIRKELYRPLAPEAINDLVIPLQIVARGFRAVFEPEAVGFEPSGGNFRVEFRRKRRIVNRSWHGVMNLPEVLDPRRVGLFAWQVWSHKVLRWLMLPLVSAAAAGCFFASSSGLLYKAGFWGFVFSLALAAIGALLPDRAGRAAWLPHTVYYFYLVNLAAVVGMAMALAGRVETLWTPERELDA